jgi:hypothetical protein
MDQPLFGETTPRHRLVNIIFGIVTAVFFVATVGLSFLAPYVTPTKCHLLYNISHYCVDALDVVLCIIILLFFIPPAIIAYWYHRGELTPKFKTLLYFNLVLIIVFCLVACVIFFEDSFIFRGTPQCNNTGCFFPY